MRWLAAVVMIFAVSTIVSFTFGFAIEMILRLLGS